ncbi:MAG TPA: ABC transporter ATP-binding protein [Solirubrobacteraceae bacterium]|nr:ABC transporter ATP-binding protein [Solirubrobacteraceae bacterium]HVP00970.1 ABC transporter ATP-binding protein [Solirubrobacteraceae bacterium]
MDAVLRATNLRKTFASDTVPVRALRGVDLRVARGEFVAIMGPSGCGKSTLLSLVAGLDVPSSGEVVVAGVKLAGRSESELARMRRAHIGIVFQFYNLLEDTPALEQVALAATLAGEPRREAQARARELLELLGLADRARQFPDALSGGERQRLAIARALANRPTLLLADEPTGALDSESGAGVLELFRRLHASGQTIVLVTHDPAVAAVASRTVRMRDGLLEADAGAPHGAPAVVS